MRLRNSRPAFPNPSSCAPRLRPRPSSDYLPKLNDPFLVEETSRRMGWSNYPLQKTESTILNNDSRKRLQLDSHKEIKEIFGDDESEYTTLMDETSNDTLVRHAGKEDNGGGGTDTTTNNQEYKDPPIDAVNFAQILRAVFSQEGYEHCCHAERENTSEWKASTKAMKEEPVEAENEVDGRKFPNQHDVKDGNSKQKGKDGCSLKNLENFLSRDEFELNNLLDMDSDECSSQLSNQLTGCRQRKKNKTDDDEDWTAEYFREIAPKRGKPKKAEEDPMKGGSGFPEKKRGRPKKVEKRNVGRPRKAISTASNVRKQEVVVERRRRGRKKAGGTPSNPILIS